MKITKELEKAFFIEVANLLRSVERREDYISEFTPVCEVNWGGVFCHLPVEIELCDLADMLHIYELEQEI